MTPQAKTRIPRTKTLKGFKSLAKRLKRETACAHNEALEQTARAMGFRNYRDAHQHYASQEGGAA